MNEKSQRAKIFLGAAQLMVAILMILLAIFLYAGMSTGWFASSAQVNASGMSVSTVGLHIFDEKISHVKITRPGRTKDPVILNADTSAWTEGDWTKNTNELLPGDEIEIKARFQVKDLPLKQAGEQGTMKVPVDFSITTPADRAAQGGQAGRVSDLPVVQKNDLKQDCYYYLSSQIWLKSADLQRDGQNKIVVMDESQLQGNAQQQTRLSSHVLGSTAPMAGPAPAIALGAENGKVKLFQLEQGWYTLTLYLTFYDDPAKNQSPLRGSDQLEEAFPSSFWRAITINEAGMPSLQ